MSKQGLSRSFSCAFAGLFDAFHHERNMKIHLIAAVSASAFGFIVGLGRLEWGLIVLSIFLVLIAETINSAIEKTVDLFTEDYHPLARMAKNLAAGAVLLSALNALIMAFIVFAPYCFR
jgi:diacylglycerol kinase